MAYVQIDIGLTSIEMHHPPCFDFSLIESLIFERRLKGFCSHIFVSVGKFGAQTKQTPVKVKADYARRQRVTRQPIQGKMKQVSHFCTVVVSAIQCYLLHTLTNHCFQYVLIFAGMAVCLSSSHSSLGFAAFLAKVTLKSGRECVTRLLRGHAA